jgi:23S rRNA (adenine2503-C2)-methyltransferase
MAHSEVKNYWAFAGRGKNGAKRARQLPARAAQMDSSNQSFHACYDEGQKAYSMPRQIESRVPDGAKSSATELSGAAKHDVLGKSREDLRASMEEIGEPAYRGAQLYRALYAERRFDFASMSTLPAELRDRLAQRFRIGIPEVSRRFHSSDGSVRYLLALDTRGEGAGESPARVEAVFMPSAGRQTICISTQAGCAVECRFCLTAQLGLVRNLTAGEILAQVLLALEEHRESLTPHTNVVLMGQGEPLLNYEPVMAALRIMFDQNGMGLGARHITLSTSGIVPGIERLGREKVRPKLAISLNASTDEERDAIMPINRKYPLKTLLEACREYPLGPREYLTFEYVLLGGFNDSTEDARRVGRLLSGMRAKVNLIPWNPGALPYRPPTAESTEEFRQALFAKGVPAFVRYSRGQDVNAACGQLALSETGSLVPAIASSAPEAPSV